MCFCGITANGQNPKAKFKFSIGEGPIKFELLPNYEQDSSATVDGYQLNFFDMVAVIEEKMNPSFLIGGTPEERFKYFLSPEQRLRFQWGRTYDDYIEWKRSAILRLGSDGSFVDASGRMWDEIQRLNALDEANKAAREAGEQANCLPGTWSNVGPFFANTTTPAQANQLHKNSTPGIGRVTVLRKHPINDILYMGAATGGLWKSVPETGNPIGHKWQVVGGGTGDVFSTMGIADIAFSPNGTTTYIATGDGTRGFDVLGQTSYSIGVLKSDDNGNSWTTLASTTTNPNQPPAEWVKEISTGQFKSLNPKYAKIHRLLVLPNGELIAAANLFINVTGSSISTNLNIHGVWKYNQAQNRWELKQEFNDFVTSIEFANTAQTAIIATSKSGQVFRSADSGNSWTLIPFSFPANGLAQSTRFSNLVHTGSQDIIYLLQLLSSANQGVAGTYSPGIVVLYQSTDGGMTFTEVAIPSTSFAVLPTDIRSVVTINPNNANEVFVGAAGHDYTGGNDGRVLYSLQMNGAVISSATPVAFSPNDKPGINLNQYVHTDLNNYEWVGNKLFLAHDGGVSYTADGGTTWSLWYETTRDLCITECLSLSQAQTGSEQFVYAGGWDNGAFKGSKAVGSSGAYNWFNIYPGDVAQIAVNPANQLGYIMEKSKVIRYQPANSNSVGSIDQLTDISPNGGLGQPESNALCDMKLFPMAPTGSPSFIRTIVSGFQKFWTIKNDGTIDYITTTCCDIPPPSPALPKTQYDNWSAIDLVNNVGSTSSVTIYAARNERVGSNSTTIVAQSVDNGQTWNKRLGNNLPTDIGKIITDIVVNPYNTDMLFATYSGFEIEPDLTIANYNAANNPTAKKVLQSLDGGNNWTDITAGAVVQTNLYNPPTLPGAVKKSMLPDLPILCAVLDATSATTWQLFIGTDIGVYYTNSTLRACPSGPQWLPFSAGLARVSVQELSITGSGNNKILRAATFGRGVWEIPLPQSFGNNCGCLSCIDEDYPFVGYIAAAPVHNGVPATVGYLSPDWDNGIADYTSICLANASSSTWDPNAASTWSFSGGQGVTNQVVLTDCNDNDISDINDYHGRCLIAAWENFSTTPQTITVHLSVTDVTGCTTTAELNIVLLPSGNNCTLDEPLQLNVREAFDICTQTEESKQGYCQHLALPGTGSLIIEPYNVFVGSGEFSYFLKRLDANGNIIATVPDTAPSATWEANGKLTYHCLEPGNYKVQVSDIVGDCSAESNTLQIEDAGTFSWNVEAAVQNSYRVCVAPAGQNGDRKVGRIDITYINGVSPSEMEGECIYSWSDCANCNTPSREGLAKGIYTVTITHIASGCSTTRSYEILFNNVTIVSGGFVVDNGGVTFNDPEPVLRIEAPSIFDDQAQVSIHLPQDMYITLSVYNSSGVLVKKILENQLKSKGVHYYMHNATNLPNGLYTYVVKGCEEQDYDSGVKY